MQQPKILLVEPRDRLCVTLFVIEFSLRPGFNKQNQFSYLIWLWPILYQIDNSWMITQMLCVVDCSYWQFNHFNVWLKNVNNVFIFAVLRRVVNFNLTTKCIGKKAYCLTNLLTKPYINACKINNILNLFVSLSLKLCFVLKKITKTKTAHLCKQIQLTTTTTYHSQPY